MWLAPQDCPSRQSLAPPSPPQKRPPCNWLPFTSSTFKKLHKGKSCKLLSAASKFNGLIVIWGALTNWGFKTRNTYTLLLHRLYSVWGCSESSRNTMGPLKCSELTWRQWHLGCHRQQIFRPALGMPCTPPSRQASVMNTDRLHGQILLSIYHCLH